MLADLDLLLTAVFCMGIGSDARLSGLPPSASVTCSRALTKRSGLHKRRDRLAETIEWLIGVFAIESRGSWIGCLYPPDERAR
ncbi:MAG TPA: hypothetical protein VJU14_11700 [Solirubrobacterales bacterium]|nr:hypothetical protein [Solirubrobacterales bacterium]